MSEHKPTNEPHKKIYLQWYYPDPEYGIQWCEDKINYLDVGYVLGKDHAALRAELEAVTKQRDELIHRANIAIGQSTNINNIYYDVSIAAMDALEMKVDELIKIRDTEPQS